MCQESLTLGLVFGSCLGRTIFISTYILKQRFLQLNQVLYHSNWEKNRVMKTLDVSFFSRISFDFETFSIINFLTKTEISVERQGL